MIMLIDDNKSGKISEAFGRFITIIDSTGTDHLYLKLHGNNYLVY